MSSGSYIGKTYMKNILIAFSLVVLFIVSFFFVLGFTQSKADEKTTAIIGHVITQKIQGNSMDHAEVFSNELASVIHKFSIEMTTVILQNMPSILDSLSAQLRLEADKKYKCSLQDNDYKNKECL